MSLLSFRLNSHTDMPLFRNLTSKLRLFQYFLAIFHSFLAWCPSAGLTYTLRYSGYTWFSRRGSYWNDVAPGCSYFKLLMVCLMWEPNVIRIHKPMNSSRTTLLLITIKHPSILALPCSGRISSFVWNIPEIQVFLGFLIGHFTTPSDSFFY